jgi:hypothetical protein
MPIGTDGDGRDDNEGPHCRNCHIGASNCNVCHSNDNANAVYGTGINVSAAYTATTTAAVANQTNYAAQSFIRQSASIGTVVGQACVDCGFSFPHRTLGANMLKDELYGVDFDGTPISAGAARTTNHGTQVENANPGSAFEYWTGEDRNATSIVEAVRTDDPRLEGVAAENMDSVCIDCHGDASYWQGDDPSLAKTTSTSPLPLGTYGSGTEMGWELLLKGLP